MQRLILAGSSLATNQCCAKIPWTEFYNSIPPKAESQAILAERLLLTRMYGPAVCCKTYFEMVVLVMR